VFFEDRPDAIEQVGHALAVGHGGVDPAAHGGHLGGVGLDGLRGALLQLIKTVHENQVGVQWTERLGQLGCQCLHRRQLALVLGREPRLGCAYQ
jgi:hypothetical protein